MRTKCTTKFKSNTLAILMHIGLFILCNTSFAQVVPEIVFKKPSEVKLDTLIFDFGNGQISKTVNFKNESGIIAAGNNVQIWRYDNNKFNIICNNKSLDDLGRNYEGKLPFNKDLRLFKIYFSPDFNTDKIETIHFYRDNQNEVDTVYSALFSYPYLKLASDDLHFRLEKAKDSLLNSTIEVQNIGLDTLFLKVNFRNNNDFFSLLKSNYMVLPQSTLDIPIRVLIPGSINFAGSDSIRLEESLTILNTQFPKNRFEKVVGLDIIKGNSEIIFFNLSLPDILRIIFAIILVLIGFFLIHRYKKSTTFFILRLKRYLNKCKNKDQYLRCLNKAATKFLPTKKKISDTKIKCFIQECINYSNGAVLKEDTINLILTETNPNYKKVNNIFKEMKDSYKDSYLTNILSKYKDKPSQKVKSILNEFLMESLRSIFDDILGIKTNHNAIERIAYKSTIEKINSVFEENNVEFNMYKQILIDTKKKFSIDDDVKALKIITDSIDICFATDSIKNSLLQQNSTSNIVTILNDDKKLVKIVSKEIGFKDERQELVSCVNNWFDENRMLTQLLDYTKEHFNVSDSEMAKNILGNVVNICLKVKEGEIGSHLSSGKDDNFCIEMLQKDTLILQDSFTTLKNNNFYEIENNQSKEDLPDIITDILSNAGNLKLKLNSTLSYADVFKQVLLKFNESIYNISNLQNWDEHLKKAFLRHFNKKNNGIEILLSKINKLQDSNTIKDNIPLDSILYTLTELYRIYAFSISECKYVTDIFNRIDFPFNEYIANSMMLKGVILKIYDINLIIPKVFEDKYDKSIHEKYTGPYVLLKDAPLNIFENLHSPTVIDIYGIGYELREKGVLKNPEVYVKS
jgi:hypothetical protein